LGVAVNAVEPLIGRAARLVNVQKPSEYKASRFFVPLCY